MKRIQNRVAEGGMTLPLAVVFAVFVWLLKGVLAHQWWIQSACFVVSVYLIVELNNRLALLRIRSRMVSTVFVILTCMSSFLFPHIESAILQLAMVASLLVLFQTYQNNQAAGQVYYAFLLLGICSCFFVQLFYWIPLLWVLMGTQILALNGRLLLASLLGIATPYWMWMPLCIIQHDFSPMVLHFQGLITFMPLREAYQTVTVNEVIVLVFITILLAISIAHFWKYSFEDKIRIRLLYGFFTVMSILTVVCILLQPQFFTKLMPFLILFSSPLIAHFFALTEGKLTNIIFVISAILSLLITSFNLWRPSLNF